MHSDMCHWTTHVVRAMVLSQGVVRAGVQTEGSEGGDSDRDMCQCQGSDRPSGVRSMLCRAVMSNKQEVCAAVQRWTLVDEKYMIGKWQ